MEVISVYIRQYKAGADPKKEGKKKVGWASAGGGGSTSFWSIFFVYPSSVLSTLFAEIIRILLFFFLFLSSLIRRRLPSYLLEFIFPFNRSESVPKMLCERRTGGGQLDATHSQVSASFTKYAATLCTHQHFKHKVKCRRLLKERRLCTAIIIPVRNIYFLLFCCCFCHPWAQAIPI